MFVIIGLGVVFGCLLLGYTMHGGKVAALIQISEFIIIGGAGLGSVIIGYGLKGTMKLFKTWIALCKGNPYNKAVFLELLVCMYDTFNTARKDGLISLERHVEEPHKSELFKKYKSFIKNKHCLEFFTDTLKIVIMGGVGTYDLSDLMDTDLESHHEEAMKTPGMFGNLGDSMPGFGIVAAVLGVVITMQYIGGKPEEIGHKVAAALVGTFLGVLMAYGIFNPLSKACEAIVDSEHQYLMAMKNAIVAFSRGDTPMICVEFARRNIRPEFRPGFGETEDACKRKTKGAGDASAEQKKAA
ncbi:MAG: flagellar motor stator protein MotA [Armatimonadota bacterium]